MILLKVNHHLQGGMRVGVVGIGGLGQMGIQLARAMGNTVTAISTSPAKEAAAREIGADSFVVSTSRESMVAAAGSLDLILNTVSATHDLNTYLPLLVSGTMYLVEANFYTLNVLVQAAKGVIVQIGFALQPHSVSQVPLIMRSLSIAGSIIGGLPATQVGITPIIQLYPYLAYDCTILANSIVTICRTA